MTFVGLLTLAPLAAFLLILLLPQSQSRIAALTFSLIIFAASLGLLILAPIDTNLAWIPSAGIHVHLGADGLSIWLVLLSTFLTPIAVLVSWKHIDHRIKAYYALLLLLEFGLVGVFLALDLFLFFVFWEVSLVPMYFLIGVWGHDRRIYAAVKFFLYTMAGSALMLVAILYIYSRTQTFDYPTILQLMESGQLLLSPAQQMALFLAFFLAFAIKVPLFPFHTWLPDAHVEAPTAGSIMLAAVMLKMGTYGLIRFCLPMFPGAARRCSGWIVTLAIIGIIYGALVAMVQPNMKKLVAYSSVSHLGFVVLGIFSFTPQGLDGAVFQMLAHGISTGALFALVGMLYERRHSLEIKDYGGVATAAPWLSTVFLVTTFASAGLPLLSNFVGEFLVLRGAAEENFRWAVWAALGVILSACYLLWLYQRVFYGETPVEVRSHMPDLSPREWAAAIPLLIMMVWLGVGAQTFLPRISEVTESILKETTLNVPFRVAAPPQPREGSSPVPVNGLPSGAEYFRFLPEIILSIAAVLVMMLEPVTGAGKKAALSYLTLAAFMGAMVAAIFADGSHGPAFSGLMVVDGFATLFRVLVIGVGALTVLISNPFLKRQGENSGEFYSLVLLSVVGQCILVTANDLIMVFIGLEISSIASYVLTGYLRDDKRANEAALKYFLLGSFATAFLLYGVAMIYGATGSTNLGQIRIAALSAADAAAVLLMGVAAALMLVGFAFKVSAAPFQMWAPDVYEGAPSPVTGFMSAGPKAAAFAVLLRVFTGAFQPIGATWGPLIWISALLSMTIGNFAALVQSNVKRMLAYSSIAHAGYVLVAITARSEDGVAAAMFYLVAYALMNVGAFAVVGHISGKGEKYVKIEDLAGLGSTQPVTAAALSIFLLSLIGVPLTGGFFGKFYIFKAAIESKLVWLAVLGLLNSAVAAYYYLRILVVMYMQEPGEAALELEPLSLSMKAALIVPAAGVLLLGIFPTALLEFAIRSAKL